MADDSDNYSAAYYERNGQDGDRPALKLFARLSEHYFDSGKVVDFGCGMGHFLPYLARHFDVSGVESGEWPRQKAAERTGFAVHDSMAAVATGSLSGVVSIHVVEHIPDEPLKQVLNDWLRALRPGGRALVITPDAGGFAARKKKERWIALTDPTHINLKTHDQWKRLFGEVGFATVAEFADGLWDFPYLFEFLGKAEVALMGWPTLAQFLLARPLLPPGSGESSIFVLQKSH